MEIRGSNPLGGTLVSRRPDQSRELVADDLVGLHPEEHAGSLADDFDGKGQAAAHDRATLEHAADEADLEEKRNERLISAGQVSLKHLTEVAERTLAIEETLRAQDDQLLRMEKAILAFEVDRSVHRAAGKARGAAAAPAAKPAK